MKKEFLSVYYKFIHSFNATVRMSPVPFLRVIRRLWSLKVLPLMNVTYTQKGDHLACSAKSMSPGTQRRSPMSQWKHVVLSKSPVMIKCLMRVKMFSTKVLVEKVCFVQRYIYMYLEKISPPLPKIRVMALPPYVSTCRKIWVSRQTSCREGV